MITDLATFALGLAVLLLSVGARPQRAHCPAGWWVNGVQPSGRYECLSPVHGDPAMDGTYGRPDRSWSDERTHAGRIYCVGNTQPIVVDHTTVGCQPRQHQ